jgi:repressor LexA
MTDITPRQKKVFDFIVSHLESRGYPPTLREIGEHLGVSGTLGVIKHLDALERKGLIRKTAGSSRGITLTGRRATVTLPIVGTVRAGIPQPAVEDIDGYFAVDGSIARSDGCFFLRVRGNSMVNAAILDGDLALVRPQAVASNGEIVVAMVDGEATLKRFYREKGRIRLQPENPDMEPIFVRKKDGEIVIVGKIIGIYRPLE